MREVVLLHRDTKGSAAWMEAAVERVATFCRWAGGDVGAIVSAVWRLYAERSPALGFWVMLETPVPSITAPVQWPAPEATIVGHLLCDIRQWDGHMVGWVTQLKMDVGHEALSDLEIAACIRAMDDWIGDRKSTRLNSSHRL